MIGDIVTVFAIMMFSAGMFGAGMVFSSWLAQRQNRRN